MPTKPWPFCWLKLLRQYTYYGILQYYEVTGVAGRRTEAGAQCRHRESILSTDKAEVGAPVFNVWHLTKSSSYT